MERRAHPMGSIPRFTRAMCEQILAQKGQLDLSTHCAGIGEQFCALPDKWDAFNRITSSILLQLIR